MKRLWVILLILAAGKVNGQQVTVGLMHNDIRVDEGYTLFAPMASTTTYLINSCGQVVHSWESAYRPGSSVYLLENGKLLRTGVSSNPEYYKPRGPGGIIEILNWDSTVEWSYALDTGRYLHHHDVAAMPNGHILAIAWEKYDSLESVNQGRDPDKLVENQIWSEVVFELDPAVPKEQAIVWKWHLWDHMVQDHDSTKPNYGVISEHPELADLNFTVVCTCADWAHLNSIDYNADRDEILLSSRAFSEFWIIDHSTSSVEAAGHAGGARGKGGDFIYRWGNPITYQRGTVEDQQTFYQHDVTWIPEGLPHAGEIMIFNNGYTRLPDPYTSIDRVSPPIDGNGNYFIDTGTNTYGPANTEVLFTSPIPTDFYASFISGVQMLPKGHLMICDGPIGNFFEVDSLGTELWRYVNPVSERGILAQGESILDFTGLNADNRVFRCTKYPVEYSGFSGHTLTAGAPIEINPVNDCMITSLSGDRAVDVQLYPNPATTTLQVAVSGVETFTVRIRDLQGRLVKEEAVSSGQAAVDLRAIGAGLYVLTIPETGYSSSFVKN